MKNPVEEFLSLKKTAAGFLENLLQGMRGGGEGSIAGMLGRAVTPALAGAAVVGGGMALSKGVGAVRERLQGAKNYQSMLSSNPMLQKEDAGKVQALYNSLHRMSPSMASDPLIAGSFVRESILKSPEEGLAVSPLTAKMLADTERSVSQSSGGHRMLDLISKMPSWPK